MNAKPAQSSAAPAQNQDLHGRLFDDSDAQALLTAVELAFDYRGDVTITRKSDGSRVEGYVFDRSPVPGSDDLVLRMIPKDSDTPVSMLLSDVAAIGFTGKDTASGRSFQNWIQKYAQKKLAGETASIESESLDGDD